MELTCITLWQPWASWIALGWKSIETRTHPQFAHVVGKRIGIHAGKRWDDQAIGLASPWLSLAQQHMSEEFRAVRGALLCTNQVIAHSRLDDSHSKRSMIDCSRTRRFGLFLGEPKKLVVPLTLTGSQGAWNTELLDFTMCRKCGCTNENACVTDRTPCHWVAPDLCSACVEPSSN